MSSQRYEEAVQLYTRALALQPSAIYYCNRAAALIKLHRCEEAIEDCNLALIIDPTYVKAFSRMGFVLKVSPHIQNRTPGPWPGRGSGGGACPHSC